MGVPDVRLLYMERHVTYMSTSFTLRFMGAAALATAIFAKHCSSPIRYLRSHLYKIRPEGCELVQSTTRGLAVMKRTAIRNLTCLDLPALWKPPPLPPPRTDCRRCTRLEVANDVWHV